jgi:hypothetical protein
MRTSWIALTLFAAACATGPAQTGVPLEEEMGSYLLVYFKDETHSLHMALSSDGYSFTDVNGGDPVMRGEDVALQKGIRDPHITRGPDNAFYLAMTDLHIFGSQRGFRETRWDRDGEGYGWGNNRGFVLMKSPDLIHWTRSNVRLDLAFPGLEEIGAAWAPQTIYDEERGKMMLYFTMRFGNGTNRLYYSYTDDDFTRVETFPELLFEYPADVSYIDGDITRVGDRYHLFYVSHEGTPGIKQAVSGSIGSGYAFDPAWYDPEEGATEAPNVWKRIGEEKWVLMYDVYGGSRRNMGFSETSDFENFTNLGHFNEGVMTTTNFERPKHGAVIQLTREEADGLASRWGLENF